MTETVGIKGERYLQREIHSKGLLNTDTSEISRYNQQRAILDRNKDMSEKVENLRQDVDEIKDMLKQLMTKVLS